MSYITKTYLETQFKNFAEKIKSLLNNKVDTVANQGLTDTEKSNARANIGAGTSSFSGSYNDLTDKPTIPTKVGELTNDKDYATKTEVTEAIDNLEIGGRNLYLGTKDFSGDWNKKEYWSVSEETYKGFTVMQRQFSWLGLSQPIDGVVGEVYTFSGYVKKTGGITYVFTNDFGGTTTKHGKIIGTKLNEWEHFSVTATVSTSGSLGFRVENGSSDETTYICGLKLEKGNKATDWTPAPEDAEEDIQAVDKKVITNLLKPTLSTTTINGITCTNNGDGTYTLNGTASANASFYFISNKNALGLTNFVGKKLKLLGNPVIGDENCRLVAVNDSWGADATDVGNGSVFTLTGNTQLLYIDIKSGFTCNNLVFKPMITTNLNATYDDFVPYTGSSGQLNSDVAEVQIALDSKAESSHTHSNYAQNAFSKVYCGGKEALIEAGTKNDSLTINPGNNISIMTDPVNKSFTISATDTNTDTKVTNTLAKTTKAYVTGTTSSSTNTGTQVFDTGVYLGTTTGTLYMDDDAYVCGYPTKDTLANHVRIYELNIGNVTINSSSPWSMDLKSTIDSLTEDGFYGACLKKCWPHSTWAFSCTLLVNGTDVYIATTTTQVYDVSILIFYSPYL